MRFYILNTWWQQKDQTYLDKPAPECCMFVQVCVTFLLPLGFKWLMMYFQRLSQ